MLEDKLLVLQLKLGNKNALGDIYGKYKNDMLALAASLSNDRHVAEDIVHDVFVSFARFAPKLQLKKSLKNYLITCVANHARHLAQSKQACLTEIEECINSLNPEQQVIAVEEFIHLDRAMLKLPYSQREVIILRFQGNMTFRDIAISLDTSINTVQSRYRYGLNKLRSLLNGEMIDEKLR